jgi:hypothetical protein
LPQRLSGAKIFVTLQFACDCPYESSFRKSFENFASSVDGIRINRDRIMRRETATGTSRTGTDRVCAAGGRATA